MSEFLVGLLLVQLLLGGYQLSYTTGVGRPESPARATRLSEPVIFAHVSLALTATGSWVVWVALDARPAAWVTFGCVALGVSLGLWMLSRTVGRSLRLPVLPGEYPDPADITVAEQLIPRPVMALHGTVATALLVLTFLVAIGVFD